MERKVYEAVNRGDGERVSRLLRTGYNVNARGVRNSSPLHLAVSKGNTDIARLLIERPDAEIDAEDDDGCTPLHKCAECGESEIAGMLLPKGASVDSRNRDGSTPLHLCAVHNSHEVADLLLEFQADVEAEKPSSLFRALHFCAQHGSFETLTVLRSCQADLNACDKDNFTPLHISIRSGKLNVAKALIEAGANVNLKNKDSATPLHLCIEWGKTTIVTSLIEAGADKGARNKNRLTPLHLCVMHGDLDTARVLLMSGAEVDSLSTHGWSPLHLCVKHGDECMATLLLARKASPETRTIKGWTPLHLCAKYKAVEIAKTLLRDGASTRASTHDGQTPLHLCARYGANALAEVLFMCCNDLDAKDKKLKTPLHISSEAGTYQIAEALISRGAVIDARDVDKNTPLHFSSEKGHVRIVGVLLDAGADYMCRNDDDDSPLLLAIEKKKHAVVSELLNKGGSEIANEIYSRGEGPLHTAVGVGSYTIVNLLIDAGARLDLTDKDGKIPLDYAHDPDEQLEELLLPEFANRRRPQLQLNLAACMVLDHSAVPMHYDSHPETPFALRPTKLPDDTVSGEDKHAPLKTEIDQYHWGKIDTATESERDDDGDSCSSFSELGEWTEDNPFGTRRGVLKMLGSLKHGDLFANNYIMDIGAVVEKPHVRVARQKHGRRRQIFIKFYWDRYLFEHIQTFHSNLQESDHVWTMLECLDTSRTGFPPSVVFEKGTCTLEEWLKAQQSLVDKKWCLRQALTGLKEVHDCYYIHGDLKPANIMFFGEEVRWKLTNWDAGRKAGEGRINMATVSCYSAPEMIELVKEEGELPIALPGLDLWSFGVLAYETLSGRRFFDDDVSLDGMLSRLREGIVKEKLLELEHPAEEALCRFLALKSEERWTAAEALQHSFFALDDCTTGL